MLSYSKTLGHLSDDRMYAIPLLAAGPGTGKSSRFLQEPPVSFIILSYLKSVLLDAVYVNITFGNGSAYSEVDVHLGIEKALSIRKYPILFLKVYLKTLVALFCFN